MNNFPFIVYIDVNIQGLPFRFYAFLILNCWYIFDVSYCPYLMGRIMFTFYFQVFVRKQVLPFMFTMIRLIFFKKNYWRKDVYNQCLPFIFKVLYRNKFYISCLPWKVVVRFFYLLRWVTGLSLPWFLVEHLSMINRFYLSSFICCILRQYWLFRAVYVNLWIFLT